MGRQKIAKLRANGDQGYEQDGDFQDSKCGHGSERNDAHVPADEPIHNQHEVRLPGRDIVVPSL